VKKWESRTAYVAGFASSASCGLYTHSSRCWARRMSPASLADISKSGVQSSSGENTDWAKLLQHAQRLYCYSNTLLRPQGFLSSLRDSKTFTFPELGPKRNLPVADLPKFNPFFNYSSSSSNKFTTDRYDPQLQACSKGRKAT